MLWLMEKLGQTRLTLLVSWVCKLANIFIHLYVDGNFLNVVGFNPNFLFLFPDVISIPKTNENFRLLYDTKGRFRLHSIRDEEAKVCFVHFLS